MPNQLSPMEVTRLEVRDHAYDVSLGGVRGLMVRVHPTGTKSFRLRYQINGHRRWYVIGEFPCIGVGVARKEARRLQGLIATGKDPAANRQEARRVRRSLRDALTVAELVERYLEVYARPQKRSAAEDERHLRKEVVARFGNLPASEFAKSHVIQILDEARARGVSGGLNTLLAIIRRMTNWAAQMDLVPVSAASGIPRPAPVRARDRVLTTDELRRYWSGLTDAPIDHRTRLALRIQALTALRIGEVAGARKIEVQLSERKFVIPGARMKAKRPHTVPLTEPVIELFREAIDVSPADSIFVFPSDRTGEAIRSDSVVRAIRNLQPYFGFAEKFTTHDVRRTAATRLVENGVPPHVVDRVLAHVPSSVLDKHYAHHSYGPEKLAALDHWAAIVLDTATRATATR